MNTARPFSSNVVILFDPYDLHSTLDEDTYYVFHRLTMFNAVHNLIITGHYGQIDLHVPTTFTFDDMREHPEVYIHTYFINNEDASLINDTEREKIRESIRRCCETTGEEFIERGIMETNEYLIDDGINITEQLLQMDRNRTSP